MEAVEFEHSPGRGDPRYTGDRSAFDVFVPFTPPGGGRGFIGIEVKYHEGLGDPEAEHRPRYDEVAAQMGCFLPEKLDAVRRRPLEQIWRDHLLTGALRLVDGYDDGFFVLLHPEKNLACVKALSAASAQSYRCSIRRFSGQVKELRNVKVMECLGTGIS